MRAGAKAYLRAETAKLRSPPSCARGATNPSAMPSTSANAPDTRSDGLRTMVTLPGGSSIHLRLRDWRLGDRKSLSLSHPISNHATDREIANHSISNAGYV